MTPFANIFYCCLVLLSCKGTVKENRRAGNVDTAVKSDTAINLDEGRDSTKINTILDSVYRLPEIQQIYKEILAAGGKTVTMQVHTVDRKPGEYEVQAGYSGDLRFEPRMSFVINVQTMQIKVSDPFRDTLLSLGSYRKLHPLKR